MILLAMVVAALVAAFTFRASLLTALATAWIVDDALRPADAIVVLGGGVNTRAFEAARLYRSGYAPRVLIMDVERMPVDRLGLTPPDVELTRMVVTQEGVPPEAVQVVGHEASSTYEEALAVRDWLARSGARTVIVPTELFHTRRVKWLFTTVIGSGSVEARVRAIPTRRYDPSNWWRREDGLIAFQNEVVKLAYYVFTY